MPATRTQIWDSDNKIKSHTSTERDALFVSDGHMVHNSEDGEMQGYDGSTSSWVSLTLPDDLCPEVPATAVAAHTHEAYAAKMHAHPEIPAGPQGEKGDQGDQGPAGPKGDKGDQGDQGPAGPKGDKGDQGDPGPAGMDGQDGAQGLPGEDGDDGQPGQPGAQGARGPRGYTGATGPQGPKGDKGDPGSTPSIPPSHNPDYHDDRYVKKGGPQIVAMGSAHHQVAAQAVSVSGGNNVSTVTYSNGQYEITYTNQLSASGQVFVQPDFGKHYAVHVGGTDQLSFRMNLKDSGNNNVVGSFRFMVVV